jgi:hypothetical protein
MSAQLLSCPYCKKNFFRDAKRVKESTKLHHKSFCSSQCMISSRLKKLTVICENHTCNKQFDKRTKEIKTHNYCSRSCAVSVNNSKSPKKPALKKICATCGKLFITLEKYCSKVCLSKTLTISEEIIIQRLKDFYRQTERIPLKREFAHTKAARKRFGSWNNAIIAAGFTPNPVMFANKCKAKDGHICDSLSEKIIDDWLSRKGIVHTRSVHYPGNARLTVDFVVKDYWIEFFGLYKQHKKYDTLRDEKLQLVSHFNIKLIELYPYHLFPMNKLEEVLTVLL